MVSPTYSSYGLEVIRTAKLVVDAVGAQVFVIDLYVL